MVENGSARKRTSLMVAGGLLLGAVFLGLILPYLPPTQSENASRPSEPNPKAIALPKEKPWQDYGKDAYTAGRRAAQKALQSPDSAEFSYPGVGQGTGWQTDGFCQWKVFGKVNLMNRLGVKVREEWSAVVQLNTGRFDVVYFQIGDETTGTIPPPRLAPGP